MPLVALLYTLQGIESDYDSKGLRLYGPGLVAEFPEKGKRFILWGPDGGAFLLRTTEVRHCRENADGSWGFASEHTTYILTPVQEAHIDG